MINSNALKRSLLFVTLLLHSCFSLAAEDVAKSDAKAQLKLKLAKLQTYQANFSQTVVDIENTLLQQANGQIILSQPNNLFWELFAPNESVLLADGENIYNVDPFLEQVVVYGADTALENNPLILLTNPESSKWQEFEVKGIDGQFIITSLETNGGIASLSLLFAGDNLIELESIDGQQQKSRLVFTEIKQNRVLPADTFLFVMPEGYELDDQR